MIHFLLRRIHSDIIREDLIVYGGFHDMKKIALINDLSGFGKCSLTAAIPVVSVMGLQAVPFPTAVLSAQTGFSNYYCDDYTDRMDFFTDSWREMDAHFDGIHSGFLASAEQLAKVTRFLDMFQTHDTIYLADPVMGDNGERIKLFTGKLLYGMKDLCARATICTPNLTELCLLTGTDYGLLVQHMGASDYTERIADVAYKLRSTMSRDGIVLVTGIIRCQGNQKFMGNLAVTASECIYLEKPYIPMSFSGTGDLFAAIVCSSLVKGMTIHDAMALATSFLQPAIEEAAKEKVDSRHGIHFEKYLSLLMK